MNTPLHNYDTLFIEISRLYRDTKDDLLSAYWKTGKHIIETENSFKDSAGGVTGSYGRQLVKRLSEDLTERYGKGFSETNIKNMRRFYRLTGKLSMSHP
jgi:hypothetical protein